MNDAEYRYTVWLGRFIIWAMALDVALFAVYTVLLVVG